MCASAILYNPALIQEIQEGNRVCQIQPDLHSDIQTERTSHYSFTQEDASDMND